MSKNTVTKTLLLGGVALGVLGIARAVEEISDPIKNKNTVLRKLEELLLPGAPLPPSQKTATPPYVQIVPGADEKSTIVYRCRYMKSKMALDALEGIISTSGTVEEVSSQNMVVINDRSNKVDELKSAVLAMDIKCPQILVEAKIIEISTDQSEQRDVQLEYTKYNPNTGLTTTWGYGLDAPSQNALPTQGSGLNWYPYAENNGSGVSKNLNLFMRWLKQSRDAKILSAPNLIVDLGTTASIVTGEDLPIQETQVNGGTVTTSTQYKRIGVKLNVTPTIINEDQVQVQINPEVSSVTRFETFTQNNITVNTPVVAIRNINTELTLHDGEIIMLGGLYSSEKVKTTRKIPFLGDLPLIGEFFTALDASDTQKQLVFFLKINILSDATQQSSVILYDPEKVAHDSNKISETLDSSTTLFPRVQIEKFERPKLDKEDADSNSDNKPPEKQ